jgi:hypothetical protein
MRPNGSLPALLQLSMNPLSILKQLMGPEIWRKFCCCIGCMCCVVFLAIFGATLGPFITLLK